jgi:predicted nucleic acid-binding protein
MTVFVDTSAFLAVLDADDAYHEQAQQIWQELIAEEETLVSSNYVLVETFALVQNRLGMAAVSVLQNSILPVINIDWVDETTHNAGVSALITAGRPPLSLVDCTSFAVMRRLGIRRAFTFDRHFSEQGFESA